MKIGWKKCSIGELCARICSGGTPKSMVSSYYGGAIPWLNTKEINFNCIYSTENTLTEEGFQNSSAKWVNSDSVIVAMYGGGTVGKCAIAKIPLTTNQACCNLEIQKEKADYRFVYYALRRDFIRLSSLANGSAQQNLNIQKIKEFDIPLPPLPIQCKIASILSSLDGKIEVNLRLIRDLEELAKAALSNWLKKNQEAISWALLSDVANVNSDAYSPKENWPFIHYLDTGGLNSGRVDDVQHIDAGKEKLPSRARRKIQPGDILFSTVRPNQRHYGMLMNPLPNMLVSTGFAVVRSRTAYASNALIYLHLIAPSFIESMQRLGEQSTSTYPSIRPSDLLSCRIPLIQTKESLKFQEKLTCFFSHIGELQEENHRLAAIRDALLPRLMSGEWDAAALQL